MDDRENLEAWADELLDKHRTVPAGAAARQRGHELQPDDPPALHLMTKLNGGQPLDPLMLERWRALAPARRRIETAEAIVTIVGVVLLCLMVWGAYRAFL